MALTPTPVCVQTPRHEFTVFNATVTIGATQQIFVAGSNGSKVLGAWANNNDTGAHVVQLWLSRGGTLSLLGSCSVAANAGNDGSTSSANLHSTILGLPQDNDAQNYYLPENGDIVLASLTSTLPVGKNVYVNVALADF